MDIEPNVISAAGRATRAIANTMGVPLITRAWLQGIGQKQLAKANREASRIDDATAMATARNDAEIMRVMGSSVDSLAKELGITDPTTKVQLLASLLSTDVRSLTNFGTIVTRADELLEDDIQVPCEGPSDEWWHRFYECGRLVASSELQDFFAAMLAGEIATPGSMSFPTIEVARRLDPGTAVMFREWVSMSIGYDHTGDRFLCTLGLDVGTNDLDDLGLSYSVVNQLMDIGLISTFRANFGPFEVPINRFLEVTYAGRTWRMERADQTDTSPLEIKLPCMIASTAGKELAKVVPIKETSTYTNQLHVYLETQRLRLTNFYQVH